MRGLFRQTPDYIPPAPRPARAAALIRAHVMIEADAEAIESLAVEMAGLPELRRLISVTGPFALVADLVSPTAAGLDAALDTIGRMKGVRRTMSAVVLGVKLSR